MPAPLSSSHPPVATPPSANGLLHALVEAQVDRTPEALAVSSEGQALTYRELERRANQLAHRLRSLGVGPEARVGVCLERGVDLIVALLGTLKAGGAYVPLDPDYPRERLAFMQRDAALTVVLTHERTAARILTPGTPVLFLDTDTRLALEPDSRPPPLTPPEALAYVIYTSGSTGTPKGAMNSHHAIRNRLLWMQEAYGLTGEDRVLQKTPASFDVSVWEFFWPLLAGARLVFARPGGHRDSAYLAELIVRERITTVHFVPSMLQLFLEEPGVERCTSLTRVICSGEALPFELQERFFSRLGAELHNLYGPTEAAVDVTAWACVRGGERRPSVPIGRPITGLRLYVLDERLERQVHGEPGELFIGGVGVGRGYLERPALTAERFVPDPFGEPGARMYRTGDLARWLPDGSLEFLGRLDHQVKVRGLRVELGELEAELLRHPAVREAVVVAREDTPGDKRLVAYLVAASGQALSVRSLRAHLLERLPEPLVPSAFVPLEAMPLTPSGKVDRRALPAPSTRLGPESADPAPSNPVEERLAALFAQVLGLERVGTREDFFELGGDSLLALRVVARAREAGLALTVERLFQARTVAALAEAATPHEPLAAPPPLEPTEEQARLQRALGAEDVYPLSPIQEGVLFHTLEAPRSGVYCEQLVLSHGPGVEEAALREAWRGALERHASLRCSFHWEGLERPVQAVHSRVELPFEVLDWSAVPPHAVSERLQALLREERRRGFELSRPPLMRLALVRLQDGGHHLVWTYHHLLVDGWATAVLLEEVFSRHAALQRSQPLHLPPVRPYRDYIAWLQQRQARSDEPFWRSWLEGLTAPTALGVDRPAPPVDAEPAEPLDVLRPLSPEASARLRAFARAHRLTLGTLVHGAWALLLGRYSGQREVLFGSTLAGRPAELPGVESMVGVFINTLPLRVRLPPQARVRPWLEELQAHQLTLRPLEHGSLVELQGFSSIPRGQPLFESILVYQNEPLAQAVARWGGGWRADAVRLPERTHFPLVVEALPGPEALALRASYSPHRLDAASVERMLGHLETLLLGLVEDPERPLGELPLLTQAERHQLLVEWNPPAPPASEQCLHELFAAQARRTPEAPALAFGSARLTYRELQERAHALAWHLRRLGVGPGVRVGLALERSVELVVALLGVLEAGGAYVPLDPSYPEERLAFMARDSGLRGVLTQSRLRERFEGWGVPVVCLDEGVGPLADEPRHPPPPVGHPDELAYVLYTSGSTGRPKGVMVTHRNAAGFFASMDEHLGREPGVWLALTSISFDISGLELLWTLTRGYEVVLQAEAGALAGGARPARRRAPDFSLFYFPDDDDGVRGPEKYRLLLEGARFADERGLHALWLPERHLHAFGGSYPNPSVAAAAVAATTRRVRVHAGSVVLPLHEPLRVAEEWAMVDNLSGGRVGLSLASGWHAHDFVLAPEHFAHRKQVLERGLEELRTLWRGGTVERQDGAGQVRAVRLRPLPVQAELPLWLTAAGNPETFERAGELGVNVLTHLLGQDVEGLAEKLARYRRAWRAHGHPGEGRVTLMLHTYLGQDKEAARARARGPFSRYLRSAADLMSLARGAGLSPDATPTAEELEAVLAQAVERYLETSGLFGTPESCLPLVHRLVALGVDELACLVDFGLETQTVLEGLERLEGLRRLTRESLEEGPEEEESLPARLARHGLTHLQCTPSLLRALLEDERVAEALRPLKRLLVGGEALPPALGAQAAARVSGQVLNMYGPTETTIWSTCQRVEAGGGPVPIGRPLANTRAYVVDGQGRLVPVGLPGELWLGGEGVARGYLGRPELSAERFVPDAFSGEPGARLYRTGDLVRWSEQGRLEFLGRLDHQVKVRGFRVELGELEAVLERQEGVRAAVAVVRQESGEARLVAYVVPVDPGAPPRGQTLLEALGRLLPGYMVPSACVVLEALPLTPNGKVDRRALPAPEQVRSAGGADAAEPRTPLERHLARLWCELLGVERVGLEDGFHALGGHSLLGLRLVSRARREGLPLTLHQLLLTPTLGELAHQLEHEAGRVPGTTRAPGTP
jgi:natural product biosynthesis luciferase-like monooxygenase protein/amino acid adenylation domain-containing protein